MTSKLVRLCLFALLTLLFLGSCDARPPIRCGRRKYYTPSTQTCCKSTVHPIPSADSVCCLDKGYLKTDGADKNPCIRPCGDGVFNTEFQSCHNGTITNRNKGRTISPPRHVPGHVIPPRAAPLPREDRMKQPSYSCGLRSYDPSTQTCCGRQVHNDMPTAESECCGDKAYLKKDRDKNNCIRLCGKQRTVFNSDTQICCGGRVSNRNKAIRFGAEKCCGATPIDPRHKTCCGDTPMNKRTMTCCEETTPYYPSLLKCNKTTKSVLPKPQEWKEQNIYEKICEQRLETWPETSRNLVLDGMVQLQGRVERCNIKLTNKFLIIPLTPVVTIQGDVSGCIKRRRLRLKIKLPSNQTSCWKEKKMKRYLRDMTVNIYVPSEAFKCQQGKYKTSLTIKPQDVALLLLSQRMDLAWMNSPL